MTQKCLDMKQDIYAFFIGFEKSFYKARHKKLIEILKTKNIDNRYIKIISNRYWVRKNKRMNQKYSNEIEILREVRQGCVLFMVLFNVCNEAILQEAILDNTKGIRINAEVVLNLRHMDDTTEIANHLLDLKNMMERSNFSCEQYGITINLKKINKMSTPKKI